MKKKECILLTQNVTDAAGYAEFYTRFNEWVEEGYEPQGGASVVNTGRGIYVYLLMVKDNVTRLMFKEFLEENDMVVPGVNAPMPEVDDLACTEDCEVCALPNAKEMEEFLEEGGEIILSDKPPTEYRDHVCVPEVNGQLCSICYGDLGDVYTGSTPRDGITD